MIEIVPFEEKFLDRLMIVENKCFSAPWSRQSFADELENDKAVYYVAIDGNKVIGYGGFWKVLNEGQITNIAVLNEYRRNGIGGELLEKILSFSGIDEFTLEVREGNIAAQELYKKFGFAVVGKRKNYYKAPTESAILMTRSDKR